MAIQTITLPDIDENADGVDIRIMRINGVAKIWVSYSHQGSGVVKGAEVLLSELTAGQRTTLSTIAQVIVGIAKPKMGF